MNKYDDNDAVGRSCIKLSFKIATTFKKYRLIRLGQLNLKFGHLASWKQILLNHLSLHRAVLLRQRWPYG